MISEKEFEKLKAKYFNCLADRKLQLGEEYCRLETKYFEALNDFWEEYKKIKDDQNRTMKLVEEAVNILQEA